MIQRLLSIFVILSGLGFIVFGLGADLLGVGGDPGIGTKQIALSLLGALFFMIGLSRKYNLDWRKIFAGPPVAPAQLLRMAIFFGLAAGLLEVLVLMGRRMFLNIIFNMNPHLIWMKPLATLAILAIITLFLLLLSWRLPQLVNLRTTAFVLVFFTFLAPLLGLPELHVAAKILLTVGLAVQISRIIAARPTGFDSLLRRAAPLTVALTAAMFLAFFAMRTIPEYRALAKLPPAPSNVPNILLLVLDTVRAQNLSVYDYERPTTPRLEQFARTGVCFERALVTSPWTLPSHATMFTGRFTHELFHDGQTPADAMTPLDNRYPTLGEILSAHGYMTGAFIGNTGYLASVFGLQRGFARYEDYVPSFELLMTSSNLTAKLVKQYREKLGIQQLSDRKNAADINQAFLDWQTRHTDRPFFAFLNYFDVHDPYIPPEPFELKFGDKKPILAHIRHDKKYKPQEIEDLRDAYDSCIAYLDHEIGLLLDTLEKRGVLENTVVIITSDHGEQFGEHGLMYHVNSLYRQLLQVPLLISFPKKAPAGMRIREAVSLRDLPTTIIDLVGLENKGRLPGFSLTRYWDNQKAAANGATQPLFAEVFIEGEQPDWFPEWWPVNKGSMQSLVAEGYHYIKCGDGSEELFDFENDPEETNNLAGSDGVQPSLTQLRSAVKTMFLSDETGK